MGPLKERERLQQTFIILNDKQDGANSRTVKVGDIEVKQERSAKLLGVTIDDSQHWNSQIYGKGGTLSSLSSRMFVVKRIQNQVGKSGIKKIVDSLYTSKLRYGLPLFGKIKWKESDPQEKWLSDLQLNQNKMMRFMNGSKLKDKISTKSILTKHDILSVNQLNAQIKLFDMWKASNVVDYPTKLKKVIANDDRATTRAVTNGNLVEEGVTIASKNTFYNDAIKAWNIAPLAIKSCKSIWSAKSEIKKYVKTLPI